MKVFKDLVKEKEQAISRIVELLSLPIKHKNVHRICKRIIRYNQELVTFLDNLLLRQLIITLERQLKPKVIMRKITFGNRSALGALNLASDNEHNPDWHLEWNRTIKYFTVFISKASNFTYGITKDKVALNLKSRG